MKLWTHTLLALTLVGISSPLPAHPGGTDSEGCHADGDARHCHAPKGSKGGSKVAVVVAPPAVADGVVEKVVDGDTIKVRVAGELWTIRLKGIDCPESHRNAKCVRDGDCDSDVGPGKIATAEMASRVQGRAVRLVGGEGKFERDRHGRRLAYVELPDGTDVGLELVTGGFCVDFSYRYPHPRSAAYLQATPAAAVPVVGPELHR